jgi:hypothetical protein
MLRFWVCWIWNSGLDLAPVESMTSGEETLQTNQVKRRILRAIGCTSFVSIAVAFVAMGREPAAIGYELSIYGSLPPIVWVCLAVSTMGGIGIIVHQAFAEREGRYWALGASVLVLGNLGTLCLPLIRGYFLYASSDTIAHFTWANDILASGYFEETNRYPILHVLTAQVAQVCGLPVHEVIGFLPALFSILFMGFNYLLGRVVLPQKPQAILTGGCATILFFSYYHAVAYPQGLSMMVLPLIFYLYFCRHRGPSLSFRLLFIVLLLFFPFFHPATAIVLIVCLAGVEVAKLVWRLRGGGNLTSGRLVSITAEPTLIALVTFFTWVSAFGFFGTAIRSTFMWLQGEVERVPRVAEVQSLFASQGLGPWRQVEIALKLYGDNLVLLAFALIALFIVAQEFVRRNDDVKNLFVLSIPFLISGPVWVLIFVTTLQVTMGRLLGSNAMMWTTPVLAGYAFHRLFEKAKGMRTIIVVSVLVCTSVVAVFGVYHAPFTLQPSWQIVPTDVYGASWFWEHHDSTAPYATMGVPPAYVWGRAEVPVHFQYDEQSTLGTSFQRDTYLLLAERFKIASMDPVLSRAMISDARLVRPGFSGADFDRLERDSSVSKLYTNGELDVFLIRSVPWP